MSLVVGRNLKATPARREPTKSKARLVFGASALLFGVIALMWHDAETWQSLRKLWSLPFGTIIGGCLMLAQIAGGLALLFSRTARAASIVLGVVYLIFSLACIPGILAAPTIYAQYGSFFEQFCLLCGAIAVYAATETNTAQAAMISRAARGGLGLCAISFTLGQIFYLRLTADLVPKWIPPNQMFWAILTTIAFALAAIAILIDRRARLAIRLMVLMLALFGALVWVPRLITHPEAHFNWSEFALTFLMTGAAWTVAAVRGSELYGGRPRAFGSRSREITPLCGKPTGREQNRCTSGSVSRRLGFGENRAESVTSTPAKSP
jgi:hypothetical protein